ncbi:MAG: hypothetical protein V1789_08610 [PVC group bacterium]
MLDKRIIRSDVLVSTICCREKDRSEGLLPAFRRYRSARIRSAAGLARRAKLPFAILSGAFGLIDAATPIPYYDKLMEEGDLEEIAAKNAAYLKGKGIGDIVFLVPDPAADPHVAPYLKSLEMAAAAAGCGLKTIFVPPYPKCSDISGKIKI